MELKSAYVAGVHYREEMIRCGKAGCKRCPHGPYWYAYHRRAAMLKKVYVGKFLPRQLREHMPESLQSLVYYD